ncbi:MAG: hypothetical protein HY785_26140 [Oscillatoriophycideae cyanobacterium NC_groundwater_1537_Pr4_S-0.65um_50_18]|nr:hypothetical protein [Oscillatoriophycideae cyanobacterium NC_groundwater_1537_Pr4_S-0.65um_50_18]
MSDSSDYLSNVVRRSFDPTIAIQPLLPSLFEPARLQPVDRSLEEDSSFLPSELQPDSQIDGSAEILDRRSPLSAADTFPAARRMDGTTQAATVSPLAAGLERSAFSPTSIQPGSDQIHPDLTAQSVPAPDLSAPHLSAAHPFSASLSVQPPAQPQSQSQSQSQSQLPTQPQSQPQAVSRSPFMPLQPQITIASKDASPWEEARQKPDAPPTVHITIGRIEVRAVAPTASARPVAKPRPSLDLEGYLKSRTGGRS